MFAILSDYYKEKNYDLLSVLNLLEASLLNVNAQLEASSRLLKEVLKRNEIREAVVTHDETHRAAKEIMEFFIIIKDWIKKKTTKMPKSSL